MSYYDDYEDYEEDQEQDQEEFNPENLQEVIEQNQKNEEEEANSQNSAGRNLGKKFSNGRKAAGESIKKAFKEALAKAMKTIAQLLAKALASPYGWIVLAVIALIIIAVIVVMKLTSDSSLEVSNDFMDSNYEDKDDITPEEKEAYEIWKVFLDQKQAGFDCCYVVISGDYQQKGYANGEWSNFSYCGFYTTIEEAENEVMAYFK